RHTPQRDFVSPPAPPRIRSTSLSPVIARYNDTALGADKQMSYPARRLDTSISFSSQVCVLGSNTRRVSVRVPFVRAVSRPLLIRSLIIGERYSAEADRIKSGGKVMPTT